MYPKGLTKEQVLSAYSSILASLGKRYTITDQQIVEGKYSHSETYLHFKANGLQVHVMFTPMHIGMENVQKEYFSASVADRHIHRCRTTEQLEYSLRVCLNLNLNGIEKIDLNAALLYRGEPVALRLKTNKGYSDIPLSYLKTYFSPDAFLNLFSGIVSNLDKETLIDQGDQLVTKRELEGRVKTDNRGEDSNFVKFVATLLRG